MSRVRHDKSNRRTAAAYDQEGSGCSSFYWLPPLSVLFFGISDRSLLLIHIPAHKVHSSNKQLLCIEKTRSIVYTGGAILECKYSALEH